jgi:hypothetical protein
MTAPHAGAELVVGTDDRPVADDSGFQDRTGADAGARADEGVPDHGTGFDDGPGVHQAAVDDRACTDDRTGGDRGAAGELGVVRDVGAVEDEALAAPAGDGRGGGVAQYEVGGAADECLGGAEVEPVSGVDHALEVGAGGEQSGEGLALDGYRAAGRDGVDDRAVEDIRARVDLVGDDLFGGLGLLQERADPPRGVGGHQPEGPGVGDPGEVQ